MEVNGGLILNYKKITERPCVWFPKGIIKKLRFALTLMVISFYLFALMKCLSCFQVPKKYEKKLNI